MVHEARRGAGRRRLGGVQGAQRELPRPGGGRGGHDARADHGRHGRRRRRAPEPAPARRARRAGGAEGRARPGEAGPPEAAREGGRQDPRKDPPAQPRPEAADGGLGRGPEGLDQRGPAHHQGHQHPARPGEEHRRRTWGGQRARPHPGLAAVGQDRRGPAAPARPRVRPLPRGLPGRRGRVPLPLRAGARPVQHRQEAADHRHPAPGRHAVAVRPRRQRRQCRRLHPAGDRRRASRPVAERHGAGRGRRDPLRTQRRGRPLRLDVRHRQDARRDQGRRRPSRGVRLVRHDQRQGQAEGLRDRGRRRVQGPPRVRAGVPGRRPADGEGRREGSEAPGFAGGQARARGLSLPRLLQRLAEPQARGPDEAGGDRPGRLRRPLLPAQGRDRRVVRRPRRRPRRQGVEAVRRAAGQLHGRAGRHRSHARHGRSGGTQAGLTADAREPARRPGLVADRAPGGAVSRERPKLNRVTSDEIREKFLSYFEERDHKRLPSASLVPRNDPSTLLISAGMHPLKPYFLGDEKPPHLRLTTCLRSFRTADIDNVGSTYRHLTFFEMPGNFSIGDYFKAQAVEYAWDFSLNGFGFEPEKVWVTVFEGDDALGLGPDEEAIEAWLSVGVPRERIVPLGRDDNFWQAGATGPCGPCSELYLDRGLEFGSEDELPGFDGERFLEYWNLVFMQYDQEPEGVLTPLPARNIDTGLGLNRLASILQGTQSVFETDQIKPLIDLSEQLSGRRYGEEFPTDRAMRILADHTRGMSFLIADGVVPSNEERGYVLRRLMRRAILQGRRIGIEPGFLPKFAQRVRELMARPYPELAEQGETIDMWLAREEETFGQTLESGSRILAEHIERAKARGEEGIGAEAAFQLHDTYGFPLELTLELAGEQGLGVDEQGFEEMMERQRQRARSAAGRGGTDALRERVQAFAEHAGRQTQFTGYETLEQATEVASVDASDVRVLAKLVESPFYATGGGQVADHGVVECEHGDCAARVLDVVRLGDDH